jgi:hypothetical protein
LLIVFCRLTMNAEQPNMLREFAVMGQPARRRRNKQFSPAPNSSGNSAEA